MAAKMATNFPIWQAANKISNDNIFAYIQHTITNLVYAIAFQGWRIQ